MAGSMSFPCHLIVRNNVSCRDADQTDGDTLKLFTHHENHLTIQKRENWDELACAKNSGTVSRDLENIDQ